MTGILGGRSQASQSPAYTALDLQTSAEGVAIAVLIGQDRIVANLIDYVDFRSRKGSVPGGKGGVVGGGKGGGIREYSVTPLLGLCEGELGGISGIWNAKSITSLDALNATLFDGGAGQVAWSYMTTHHPDRARAYPHTAYVAIENLQLGNTPNLGNFSFDAQHTRTGVIGQPGPDVEIAEIIRLILSEERLGIGFAALADGFNDARAYTQAMGLRGSVYVREQAPVRELAERLAKSANLQFRWSGNALELIPLGDFDVAGNGATWTAPSAVSFDLGADDFMAPLRQERTRSSDVRNKVKLEWKKRSNQYNTATVEWVDEASVSQIGEKLAPVITGHHFKTEAAALTSVQLQGQAMLNRNAWQAQLDARYAALEPLDLVSLTDEVADLVQVWARVETVDIAPNGSVSILVKERIAGHGEPGGAGSLVSGSHAAVDQDEAAPAAAEPYIFEPPAVLTDGERQVWIAITGGDNWGGCEVWVSDDDTTYRMVDVIYGRARYGEMAEALPAEDTPDESNTPEVDLAASEGELASGTTTDAEMLNTLAMVDRELIAYRDADLVGTNAYELSYIVRGAHGTEIRDHAIGAPFVRLDDNIAVFPFDRNRVGATIYLKFVSFNAFGSGKQDIADVTAYPFELKGLSFGYGEVEADLQDQLDWAHGRQLRADDGELLRADDGTYLRG